jgi:carbonic anhydrase
MYGSISLCYFQLGRDIDNMPAAESAARCCPSLPDVRVRGTLMDKQSKSHTTRRELLTAGGLMLAAIPLAHSADECAVFTKDLQAATTPALALERLKAGNARFIAGRTEYCDLRVQVHNTAKGQAPFAAVLGCMDSRVPPELVFDQRIGDIFAVRIAGNFVNPDITGSLEYATKVAGAKLIVVLGHSDCGAVKGAIDDVKLGNLTTTLANIRPSVAEVTAKKGKSTSSDKKFVQAVAEQNVHDALLSLAAHSEVLTGLVAAGQLTILAAMHDVNTGVVTWLV